MNEQQLQQAFQSLQQAITAAVTGAFINSLLNPQQAAAANNLANIAAAANPSVNSETTLADLQQLQQQLQQHQQQQQQLLNIQADNNSRSSPNASNSSPNSNHTANLESNNRIQELLLQLQQQAALGQSPLALNLNQLAQQQHAGQLGGSPSPLSAAARLTAQDFNAPPPPPATTSNIPQLGSPIKKLKRHHHSQPHHHAQATSPFQNRSSSTAVSEATSIKPPASHLSPPPSKNHHSNLANSNAGARSTTNSGSSNTGATSNAFMTNNVGLPRKLVRGQDVWLGRGAEQTRQILKCMWCGQSFRTLAEMTQHMKITQHYTNIISQEQITSWRQPESSSKQNSGNSNNNNNLNTGSKQTSAASIRLLEDNQDELSEKFDEDSDGEDSFSNDEETATTTTSPDSKKQHQATHKLSRINKSDNRTSIKISDTVTDNDCAKFDSSHESDPDTYDKSPESQKISPISRQQQPGPKKGAPDQSIKSQQQLQDAMDREHSPTSSPPSQRHRNSSCLISGDSNENSNASKTSSSNEKINGNANDETDQFDNNRDNEVLSDNEDSLKQASVAIPVSDDEHDEDGTVGDDDDGDDVDRRPVKKVAKSKQLASSEPADVKIDECRKASDSEQVRGPKTQVKGDDSADQVDDECDDGDTTAENVAESQIKDDEEEEDDEDKLLTSENEEPSNESRPAATANAAAAAAMAAAAAVVAGQKSIGQQGAGNQKGETGDPLSALETMVEKSFDPRLRPGVANGGILQRLGIDEEVCPPWQHINYANWYAAAAYGHPMAAALLAAGINFQNGIKLSKNLGAKKNDD